ncbi:MAG: response regulator [Janthinobacterium lividum]
MADALVVDGAACQYRVANSKLFASARLPASPGTSLPNVRRRLALSYPGCHELTVEDRPDSCLHSFTAATMTLLNCLLLEDKPLARKLLLDYVQQVPYLRLVAACAAFAALQGQAVDLLFLDVQLPEMTGLTFLKLLPRKPLVVLTTAYLTQVAE